MFASGVFSSVNNSAQDIRNLLTNNSVDVDALSQINLNIANTGNIKMIPTQMSSAAK